MCPNKDLSEEKKGFMEKTLFQKIINEIAFYHPEINLHHRGESLLHPEFEELLKITAANGLKAKIHTNGTLLDKAKIRAIVESGALKRVSFSFDGFVREDYEKIRVGANFEQTVENIIALLDWRRKLKLKLPVIAIEVIALSPEQVAKIKSSDLLRKFKDYGIDELKIKKSHNWAGYLKSNFDQKNFIACTFLWNAMVILYNGDVSACSQDFFGKLIVGNAYQKKLIEIFNDLPLVQLRLAMAEKKLPSDLICLQCDRIWRKKIFGIPVEYLKEFLWKKMP